ncbi:sensor histidine kinase [Larkinella humicola]|uniref:Histidine kinase n=1 Tax=Larkinella humicola TaxID=2607654 RepID=A0A5N1JKJ5_9BACT|nr:histidine kinase [Larkinella humicola]KAA9356388.1 histidine kinase [Larkinella humicola]
MKKTIFAIIAGCLTLTSVQAQINWGDYSQSFSAEVGNKSSAVGLILAIRKENNAFWEIRDKSRHVLALEKDPIFQRERPRGFVARTTFDTARAQFFLHGVGPQMAWQYQFRVMEYPGHRVLVPWHGIERFTDSTLIHDSGMPAMAYLGGYRTRLGKMLIVDVRNTGQNQIVATSLVAWESVKPVITSVYTSETIDEFFQKLQSPWLPDRQSTGSFPPVFTVPSTNENLIFALEKGQFSKKQIQYELIRTGSVYTPWRDNAFNNSFIWIKDCPPGAYTIRIRYSAQPQHVTEYRFDVKPAWYQSNQFVLLAVIFSSVLLGACLFLLLFIRQRRKTRLEQADKNRLQLELKAIHAQLNPHFVFNALSSIQGLINKEDIEGANRYLSDFARLLRESLHHAHKNELSLHEEIQMLDTYLKLEQLRFGFQYSIRADIAINVYETAIPVMLLQPLVENAVKHGVASQQKKGVIAVVFSRLDQVMTVAITDNGRGFTEEKAGNGLGLSLTRDRIERLNKLHSDGQITLFIQKATPSGTQITLTFGAWF